MIAKASAVSHGYIAASYNMNKQQAEFIASNKLETDQLGIYFPTSDEVWSQMCKTQQQYGRRLKNSVFRFEISPSKEESRNFTMLDWEKLVYDFVRFMDSIPVQGGRKRNHSDLMNSQFVAMLHLDSKSGVPHIHLLVNRVTEDGFVQSDRFIGRRAALAANKVAIVRGWKLASHIRENHRNEIRSLCYKILKEMDKFDWNVYFSKIQAAGFFVPNYSIKHDSTGKIRGYSIAYGMSSVKSMGLDKVSYKGRFTASEIDAGLTYGKIERTWKQLHNDAQGRNLEQKTMEKAIFKYDDHSESVSQGREADYVSHTLRIPNGHVAEIKVPRRVYEIMKAESVQAASCNQLAFDAVMDMTVQIFVGMFLPPAYTVPLGGGGSSSGGKRKKEDEEEFIKARNAVRAAVSHLKPRRKMRR